MSSGNYHARRFPSIFAAVNSAPRTAAVRLQTAPFQAKTQPASETLNVVSSRKLLHPAAQFQFEQRGKNLGRTQFRFELFHDFIEQQRLVMAQDAEDQRLGPGQRYRLK